jgi:hypothetical protein
VEVCALMLAYPERENSSSCVCYTNTADSRVFSLQVTIQSPVEYPEIFYGNVFRAATGTETSVSIKPNMVITSSSLRKMDPSIRQCYFAGEKNLSMFAVSVC